MNESILVIGADGLIGRALVERLERSGRGCVATTRRRPATGPRRIHLDLESTETWNIPLGVDSAILCAAITGEERIRDDPVRAAAVNVRSAIQLSRRLAAEGIFVTFLSSSLVFDGEVPRVPPAARTNPRTAYGRLKADSERRLQGEIDGLAIVRLSKVFSSGSPLLRAWRNMLSAGCKVEALSDYPCAPLDLTDSVDAISRVASECRRGIWQLSPYDDVSYEEIAREVARRCGADSRLVEPVPSSERLGRTHVPAHATLDTARAREELGCEFPPMPAVLARIWDAQGGPSR